MGRDAFFLYDEIIGHSTNKVDDVLYRRRVTEYSFRVTE